MAGTYRRKWHGTKQSQEDSDLNFLRRWTVKTVELNRPRPDSDFQILPKRGTLVEDTVSKRTFRFGPGMPADTMDNGLNRKYMEWLDSGARGPYPFAPKKTISPWERWKPVILLVSLIVCVATIAGSVYWRSSDQKDGKPPAE